MGIPIMSRGGNTDPPRGNPVPSRFTIQRVHRLRGGRSVAVMLTYPDCTNFEGTKILVFDNFRTWYRLLNSGTVDPHFMESEPALIARFRPTEEGWQLARDLVERLR